MKKMLMNPATGNVSSLSEWLEDFQAMTAEEWGGENFEDAALVEVVPNIEGEEGYDPSCGEWREIRD